MKLAINETLDLTDEQRTINGELLLGKQLKPLFARALRDLADGKKVSLASYGLEDKLREVLATVEAREMAVFVIKDLGAPPGTLVMPPLESQWGQMTPCDCGTPPTPHFKEGHTSGILPGGAYLQQMSEGTRPLSERPAEDDLVDEDCSACGVEMGPEEVGRCEACMDRIHPGCRSQAVQAVVTTHGPLPIHLRDHVDPEGQPVPAPYLCGSCLLEALRPEDDPADGDDPGIP